MNIQQLKYVVAVANNGSFREAAKKMYVTQPSLSNGIKELEETLGITLFTRTNRGAYLTEDGQDFLERAEKILVQLDALEGRYQTENNPEIFSVASQHYDFLGPVMAQILKEYSSEIHQFRIIETTTAKVIEEVHEQHSELGILYLNEKNASGINRYLKQNELLARPLGDFRTHIFLNQNHPLAQQEEIALESLSQYPQVRFTQDGNNFPYFSEDLIETQEQESVLYVSDRGTLMNILLGSNAYASGSGVVIGEIKEHIRLVPLKNSEVNQMNVIYSNKHQLSASAQRFVEILEQLFAKEN
ncbi:MAG: LysR family transcriptional regulator [Enterococcus sp.]